MALMKIFQSILSRPRVAAASAAIVVLPLLTIFWRAFDAPPQRADTSLTGADSFKSSTTAQATRSADSTNEQATTAVSGPALATRTATPSTLLSANTALAQELRSGAIQVLVRDEFSRQQVAVRDVVCEDRQCAMQLQIPPFAEAALRHDLKVTSDLFDALRKAYKDQGAEVALSELSQSEEGMRISLHIDATSPQGRLMTNADIAKLRAETLTAYLNAQQANGDKGRAVPGDRHVP